VGAGYQQYPLSRSLDELSYRSTEGQCLGWDATRTTGMARKLAGCAPAREAYTRNVNCMELGLALLPSTTTHAAGLQIHRID